MQLPTLKSQQVQRTILAMWGHNMQGTTSFKSQEFITVTLYTKRSFSRINKIYCRGDIHVYMNNDVYWRRVHATENTLNMTLSRKAFSDVFGVNVKVLFSKIFYDMDGMSFA